MYDIVIIGSGVAGMTAGIYGGRANKKVLIIEDNNIGGTTATLDIITNYPGFDSISGLELVTNMQMQCIKFGVEFQFGDIVEIDFDKSQIIMKGKSIVEYKTLIIASGTTSQKLNIRGEDTYKMKGVSYCAVCDGNLYKGKNIVVFTNGNSAKSDIDYLLNITKNIIVFDITDIYKNDSITVYNNVKPIEIAGDKIVKNVSVKINDNIQIFDCDGIFVDMGKCTDLHLFKNRLETKNNQVCSDENMHTNISNVFVAGDIRYKSLKQIITACSDGAIASTEAIKFISK